MKVIQNHGNRIPKNRQLQTAICPTCHCQFQYSVTSDLDIIYPEMEKFKLTCPECQEIVSYFNLEGEIVKK